MLRLTNQSTGMERPSADRLFVRNGLFWSPPPTPAHPSTKLIAQDKERILQQCGIRTSPRLLNLIGPCFFSFFFFFCFRRHCPLVLSRAPGYFSSLKVRSVTQSSPRPLHQITPGVFQLPWSYPFLKALRVCCWALWGPHL